ncbi:hypothetical protein [Nocardia sp. NBC_01327]|uniref:hypothetical protein n=1 Tax=Nocardia sp. NBC_01327 TaxID=2903593 RepID=UPI002E15D801|nr:hypothetical protein OG326_42445 [Nocardia sp. NBC_01327]
MAVHPVTALAPPLNMRTYPDGHITYDVQLAPDLTMHVASLWPHGTRYQLFVGCGPELIVTGTAAAEIHILREALTLTAESSANWYEKTDLLSNALLDLTRHRVALARGENPSP